MAQFLDWYAEQHQNCMSGGDQNVLARTAALNQSRIWETVHMQAS